MQVRARSVCVRNQHVSLRCMHAATHICFSRPASACFLLLQALAASGRLPPPVSACSAQCPTNAGMLTGATPPMWRWGATMRVLRRGLRCGVGAVGWQELATGSCTDKVLQGSLLNAPAPSPSRLQGVDRFDAAAFRLSRAEATALDPQTRLLLQVTQEALADAGGSVSLSMGICLA